MTSWGVVSGVLVGFVAGFAAMFLGAVLMGNLMLEVPSWLIFGPALLLGIVLLALPRTRQAGAGFVAGLAVGSIISAGTCVAFFAQFGGI